MVEPKNHHERSRLIPIDAIASSDPKITLSWSSSRIEAAPLVETTDFVSLGSWPNPEPGFDVGVTRLLAWPYYSSFESPNYGAGLGLGYGWNDQTTTYDQIPAGRVEIRRASNVVDCDGGHVGKVDGFIVDDEHRITHMVLEHGHLWGHRDITIPLTDVAKVSSDTVKLGVPKDAVGDYPSVQFHRHTGVVYQ